MVTLAISEASYRVLELPIRRGSLRGWRIRIAAPVAAAAAFVAVIAGTAAPAPASVVLRESKPVVPSATATATAASHRLLVVGDSGAAFLGEGLVRVGPTEHMQVRNSGAIACGLVTAGGKLRLDADTYLDDPPGCEQWPDRWRADLLSFQPDVVLLVIGWPGLGDRLVDGEWRHPCDPVFDGYYASEVRRALIVLSATGASVVVADSPYLTLPVGPDASNRVDCLNLIYRREAAVAGASVLPVREWLCDDARRCTIEKEGVTLRIDGIHFRDGGADIAARWALPQLSADTESRSEGRSGTEK